MASPCAACKFLRRKCTNGCIFAQYFPPDDPDKFSSVHKVFGASNVAKLLNELPSNSERERAVCSLAYEAAARIKDPVYGCVAHISELQLKINEMKEQLILTRKELSTYTGQSSCSSFHPSNSLIGQNHLSATAPVTYMAGPYGTSNVRIGMDLGLGNSVAIASHSALQFRDMKEAQHRIEMDALRQQNLIQMNAGAIEGVRGAYNGNFSTNISSSIPCTVELASSQMAQIQRHQIPQVPAQEFNGVFVARPPPPELLQWQMQPQMQLPMQYYMEQMKQPQQQQIRVGSDEERCCTRRSSFP